MWIALIAILLLLGLLIYARLRLVHWRNEARRVMNMLEDGEMAIRVDPDDPVIKMRLHLEQDR